MSRLIFLFIMVSSVAFSQSQSALWKVSGNGIKEPSYLFGTINFLPKDGYIIPKPVSEALSSCEVFATKMALDRKTQKQFNDAVKIPNNGWINDYLTDDELNQLRLLLLLDYEVKETTYHDFYSRLQPIILVTATAALHLGSNITYPEKELEAMAKKENLKFVGLSNIDEEIEAFKQFPIKDQVEALKYTVNNFYQHIKDYENMVSAYLKEQDLVAVKNETFKATNKSQAFKKVYYDDRTKAWLSQIKKQMKSKPAFVALGAPYLVGKEGLIEMLKQDGYRVEPIAMEFVPPKTSY
ncbi:MAG: TraB/GumN family protein [Bacteroidota bacterium]